MRRAVLLLALLLCATLAIGQDGARFVLTEGPDGNVVQILELPNVPCPMIVTRGADVAGCYWQGPVVMGYGTDPLAREHEIKFHGAGGKHGPWFAAGNGDKCALITAAGYTRWTQGKLMCRRQDGIGDYYQIDP